MRGTASRLAILLTLLVFPATALAADFYTGLEIGVRGGWYFQLNQPVQDTVLDRGRVTPGGSLGIDIEAGASLGDHLSILLRFGYKSRIEEWESVDETAIEDMKLVHSLVHLPSVNVKVRPFIKRVSLYFTAGGGMDLVVWEPTFGVGKWSTVRQPGAGINFGLGGELFITRKFAIVVDLRDNLSLHGAETLRIEDADSGELYYDLTFQPVLHVLSLYAGIELSL